ncbi:MAG: hypothetical protein OEQ39_14600 [Gammaproteobacteria bacterium]|nr:hypothetical protein [Gammaproteobacteria bacterium]MDH3468729.1 hypothetical protein [Gammaproteobacteria bacterium]
MLNPFIHRSLFKTDQVWVVPVFAASDKAWRMPIEATVVIRTYPLLMWLWVGLTMVCVGSMVITFRNGESRLVF